jgi:Phosphodiester glycosidase
MLPKRKLSLGLLAATVLLSGARPDYLPSYLSSRFVASARQGSSRSTTEAGTPGVVWSTKKYVNSAYGNQVVNILDINLSEVSFRTVETQYPNKYETVLSMGNRTKALAGINGGFFCYTADDICGSSACKNAPPCLKDKVKGLSLLKTHGHLVSTNCALRTSLGISSGAPTIKQIGSGKNFPGVDYAIGAGPNLVSGGNKKITQEGFCWYKESAARTAVATIAGGHILFVTVDQGYTGADGMTIDMLATFLIKEFNAISAMNFDGGGSTTMFYQGKIVNKPSDQSCGCCRCVYDGLFVYSK